MTADYQPGDTDNNLLWKIAIAWGAAGENYPQPGDTDNTLLRKILQTLLGA